MIRLLLDSASDFPAEKCAALGIEMIPMQIMLGDQAYLDGVTLKKDALYRFLAENKEFPKTSQPSPHAFLRVFEKVRDSGDEMICLLLSSRLSGTFQSAAMAKEMCGYEKIYLIDSLSVSVPVALLAEQALLLRGKGVGAAEIVRALESMKGRIRLIAGLDTLEYLARGGRMPRAAALLGSTFRLKPLITLEKGKAALCDKQIGRIRAMDAILQRIKREPPAAGSALYPLYSDGEKNCLQLERKLQEAGYSLEKRTQIGAAIGVHVGPGAYGVAYLAEK